MDPDGGPHRAAEHRRKRRNVDWLKVRDMVDSLPGQDVYVGIMDQSMRTHIRNGRIAYIDPSRYDVWTVKHQAKQAHLFMRLK